MRDILYYANQLNLRNFTVNRDNINFSCPYCGDSSKNRRKKRGFIFKYKNNYFYKCHNCSVSKKFEYFLKDQNSLVYNQYLKTLLDLSVGKKTSVDSTVIKNDKNVVIKNPLHNLKRVSDLPDTHISKEYLNSRKIPEDKFSRLFFSENFKKRINEIESFRFNNYPISDKRIVIPGFTRKKSLVFFQGRTIDNDKLRYITFKFLKEYPRIFGIEFLDGHKQVYVTEGAFDSLFLDNCISVQGSDLAMDFLKILNPVLIYDNEPRNEFVVKKVLSAIDKGFKIVIHDAKIEYKDLNEMVLNGLDVTSYVKERTFSGLRAKLELTNWSKIEW